MTDKTPAPAKPQKARLDLKAGPVSVKMAVRVTPGGILAIGGLVSGILLSTAVLVRTAVAAARR